MADLVQAKNDLEFCCNELNKYETLTRTGLTLNELMAIDGVMKRLKGRIKNLRRVLLDA